MLAPLLDDHPSLDAVAKPFKIQAFVPELSGEALVRPALPRPSGVDQRRLDAAFFEPAQDRIAHELRAVVRTQIRRRAVRE